MAKQKQKTKETEENTEEKPTNMKKETSETTLYPLIDLVQICPVEEPWIIYNLARAGLLNQYEQEMKDYKTKNIEPTITIQEFDDIINGRK